jgi:hypothetical protein
MNAAAVARGPDEDRVYTDFFSGVSLGARRRRIIDVKGGRQPASNEDGATRTERYGRAQGRGLQPPAMRDSNSPSTTARRPKGRPTGRP